MDTELKHANCNGWVIVEKSQVDCDSAANYHLVEVSITPHPNGERDVCVNTDRETCCGRKLLPQIEYLKGYVFLKSEVNNLRTTLAKQQNGTWEICGICVGHFYKDTE